MARLPILNPRSYMDVSTIIAWMGRMLHRILTLQEKAALANEARHVLVLYRAFRHLGLPTWFSNELSSKCRKLQRYVKPNFG